MSPTAVAVLAIVATVLSSASIILHIVRPTWKLTALVDQLGELVKKMGTTALVLLFVGLAACGASARSKTISTTLTTVNASAAGFVAFDAEHQTGIVNLAKDKASAQDALSTWRKTQLEVETSLAGAYRAIAVAAQLNDDQSLASMVQAAAMLQKELEAIGVTK